MHAGHHHETKESSDLRLIVAVAVNLLLTLAQIVGGVISGSLALVADALHNFNDAASLGIALVARRVARRPADRQRTFGYQRAESIGALINLTTLIIVGLYLIYEAVVRYFQDQAIDGWIVIIVAGIALVVDIITAVLVYLESQGSLNIRAAFVHNVADALASVGVIVAGSLILLYDWTIADLLATVVISAYILYQGITLGRQAIHSLLDGVPDDIDLDEIVRAMESVDGVREIHHLHIWELGEDSRALEAHVVVRDNEPGRMEPVKRQLKALLAEDFHIHHCTLEFESVSTVDSSTHDTALIPKHDGSRSET
ncbi:MAG: cation diffusion facilitator family transporter [Thermomicrobiales bacterium]